MRRILPRDADWTVHASIWIWLAVAGAVAVQLATVLVGFLL